MFNTGILLSEGWRGGGMSLKHTFSAPNVVVTTVVVFPFLTNRVYNISAHATEWFQPPFTASQYCNTHKYIAYILLYNVSLQHLLCCFLPQAS